MSNLEKLIANVEDVDLKINALKQTIAEELKSLEKSRADAVSKLDEEIIKEASEQLSDKDYGCGTANIELDNIKIKVEVKKTVKWDEKYLRENIEPLIKAAGREPEDFIKYKRSVGETDFKAFNDDMKRMFMPARTVTPSKPKITMERKV